MLKGLHFMPNKSKQTLLAVTCLMGLTGCAIFSSKSIALSYCERPDFLSYQSAYESNKAEALHSNPKDAIEFEFCDSKFKKVDELNDMIGEAGAILRKCSFDKSDYSYDKHLNITYAELEKRANLSENNPLQYLVDHYPNERLRYEGQPQLYQFNVEEAKSCIDFYKKTKIEVDEQMKQDKINEANDKNFAKKRGYKDMWKKGGVMGAIVVTQYGEMKLAEAKQYLIRKDDAGFDPSLVVQGVVSNSVVYVSTMDRSFRFAVKRESGGFYPKGSMLKGEYFAIIDKGTLKTVWGNSEVLILKQVK